MKREVAVHYATVRRVISAEYVRKDAGEGEYEHDRAANVCKAGACPKCRIETPVPKAEGFEAKVSIRIT